MTRSSKRPYSDISSPIPPLDSSPRPQNQTQISGKRPTFPFFTDAPDLPYKIKLLCEIIANTSCPQIDVVLTDTGIRVSQEDVEQTLKLSYGSPSSAVKFFRWAGYQLNNKHSPYSWNLVVDLLGKNSLFEAMWDAIKSMRIENIISLATFASVFSSYISADRHHDAIKAFEVMDRYGCPRDIVALNSLLSATCRERKTSIAEDFFHIGITKAGIHPDADSFAILLEGWESEENMRSADKTFEEMVITIGWDPFNVPAYDSYLCTLLKSGLDLAMKSFHAMIVHNCFPSSRFLKAALQECVKTSARDDAESLWEPLAKRGTLTLDTETCNLMIAIRCSENKTQKALELLDEMVYNGVFPDSQTYNLLFKFLIKGRKLPDASTIFTEMVKNEFIPTHENCSSGIRVFMENGDSYWGIRLWKCMIDNYDEGLEETGNILVGGLREVNRLPEAMKYAENMIERRLKVNSSTLARLKQSLSKSGKMYAFEELLRKWKTW